MISMSSKLKNDPDSQPSQNCHYQLEELCENARGTGEPEKKCVELICLALPLKPQKVCVYPIHWH